MCKAHITMYRYRVKKLIYYYAYLTFTPYEINVLSTVAPLRVYGAGGTGRLRL